MSQSLPLRIPSLVVLLALISSSTAWAAPPPVRAAQSDLATEMRGQHRDSAESTALRGAALSSTAPEDRSPNPQPGPASATSHVEPSNGEGFSEEERAKMKARQDQARDLKDYKGGEVIVIGSGVLLVALVVLLVVVIVD